MKKTKIIQEEKKKAKENKIFWASARQMRANLIETPTRFKNNIDFSMVVSIRSDAAH